MAGRRRPYDREQIPFYMDKTLYEAWKKTGFPKDMQLTLNTLLREYMRRMGRIASNDPYSQAPTQSEAAAVADILLRAEQTEIEEARQAAAALAGIAQEEEEAERVTEDRQRRIHATLQQALNGDAAATYRDLLDPSLTDRATQRLRERATTIDPDLDDLTDIEIYRTVAMLAEEAARG